MTLDGLSMIATIHRLAAADHAACRRVARLLDITEIEADAMIGLADSSPATRERLQADLELSDGGLTALTHRLVHDVLARQAPDPARPRIPRVCLSGAGFRELAAVLGPLTDRLESAAADLSAADHEIVARYLNGVVAAAGQFAAVQPGGA